MEMLINQIESLRKNLEDRFAHLPFPYSEKIEESFSKKMDHTLLKPDATQEQIERVCREAIEHNFYSVCIPSSYLSFAQEILDESSVKLVTVVGFPTGATTTEAKIFETLDAIDHGANEIDMVIHIGKLKSNLLEDMYQDISLVAGQADNIPIKVILETCLLTQEEKITACILAQMAGAAFIKTSTGFSTAGATQEDISLIKKVVGEKMGIKASGGIKDLKTALLMLNAGATRLGTSNSVSIMKELHDKN